jgi:N-acetylglucosaminyldiphosphoundecaprenol N-acetyl-beta-D-mannosaminyltransferase
VLDIWVIGSVIALSTLGTIIGLLAPRALGLATPPEYGKGRYVGGLPVVLATLCPLLHPGVPLTTADLAIPVGVCLAAGLGLARDLRRLRRTTGLIILTLCSLGWATWNHGFATSWMWFIEGFWPPVVVLSLLAASLVYEMPLLLTAVSGLTFLLFFPTQMATPPWAVLFTLPLLLVPSAMLVMWFGFGRMRQLGHSGLFALSALLAGVSLLGRSKTLLLFGLLVPAMATLFPVAAVCALIIASFLGNELYQEGAAGGGSRAAGSRTRVWTLQRESVVLYTTLVFLAGNFVVLLGVVDAPWWAWLFLAVLLAGTVAGFWRTFARRAPRSANGAVGGRVRILGVAIDPVTPDEVLDRLAGWLAGPPGFYHLVTADSLAVRRAREDPAFARLLEQAALTVPDGAGLVWAADFLGTPVPGRVPGVAMVQEICQRAARQGWPVYFLGARPGVAQAAAAALAARFPGLTVAGVQHGFFPAGGPEEEAVLAAVRAARPAIVFVAMGVPRQEEFIDRLRARPGLDHPLVAIGVGGSFDVLSGQIPRAPVLMQRFALEWLFRLWQEPARLDRIARIPGFVVQVLRAKWRSDQRLPSSRRAAAARSADSRPA